ncbi:hypothetical protein TEA_025644 [Camellia sinensis var. sinensis]|uniref:Large ribosomal subunit protein uL10-like insertion domain-containing protein n=1 Tax=Camellia sinensis var. sinensis TaxID=542762 RepID=A0A4S4F069_CAMSN|nr:hypothetical protein TEA_025644 [Camellia sinensis var. sinensis]
MVVKASKAERKSSYDTKLCRLLDIYSQILIVAADNVGSNQLQNIRKGLRGESVVLMGKNTMMKRSIRAHAEKTGSTAFLSLVPLLVGNVGLIFTKGDLKEVSDEVAKYKVGAPARVGLIAPIDVVVPPGNTGLDPSQTSFFQVLNIPTKINKGTVEIITPVELIKKGEKVGSSEAALLSKLLIRPFSYGLVVLSVYDNGSVFSPEVLHLTDDDLMVKFASGISMVAALSMALTYPTLAAAPHMFINAYKNVLAVAVETPYSFTYAETVKEYLKVSTYLWIQVSCQWDEVEFVVSCPHPIPIFDESGTGVRKSPARVGLIAPIDVVVPPGNTGLDPSQTSFFQVLNIPTKINKGTVEIITPVELIKKGEKVGSSEAALLSKLLIRPFSYGLVVLSVYDNGSVFSPEVLHLTDDDLMVKFASGISMVAALSLALTYPTLAAAPHMFINAYKNVLAVAVETPYSFTYAETVKEYLKSHVNGDEVEFVVSCPHPIPIFDEGGTGVRKCLKNEKLFFVKIEDTKTNNISDTSEEALYSVKFHKWNEDKRPT